MTTQTDVPVQAKVPGSSDQAQTIKAMIVLAVALVIGAGVYSFVKSRKASKFEKASQQYFLAMEAFQKESMGAQLKGEIPGIREKFKESIASLEAVSKLDPGSKESFLASKKLATLFSEHGPAQEANSYFELSVKNATDAIERSATHLAWGYHLIKMTDFTGAIAQFDASLKEAVYSPQKADALLGLASAKKAKGDVAGAISDLDRLSKEFSQLPQARVAETLKSEWK